MEDFVNTLFLTLEYNLYILYSKKEMQKEIMIDLASNLDLILWHIYLKKAHL